MKKAAIPLIILTLCNLVLVAQGTEDSLIWSIPLDNVVVTAQYAPTATENTIHEVKVIKADAIARQGMRNLTEVLAQQLNFRVSTDPILGNGVRIQGIGGENVQVTIDGVPVIGRVNGNIDLSQIRLTDVVRIEIIEGAMSAQYGNNAAGGIINIITKKTQLDRHNVSLVSQYEDIGIQNYDALVSSQFHRFFVSINGGYSKSQFAPNDSMRLLTTTQLADGSIVLRRKNPWNPKEQYNLNGKLSYRLGDSATITYQRRYFNEEVYLFGPVKRPTFRPYAFDETYLTVRNDHHLNAEIWLYPYLYLQSQTALNDFKRTKLYDRLDFENDTTQAINTEQDTSLFRAVLHRTTLSTAFAGKFDGQIGFEYSHETASGRRILDEIENNSNPEAQNIASWVSLRWRIQPALSVQTNLRYGRNNRFDHPLLPAFNLRWKLHPNWILRTSYARGFRAPSLKELYFNFIDINHFIVGNIDLKAEYSNNARISFDYKKALTPDRQIHMVVKGFHNSIRNRITLAEFAPLQFNYENLEKLTTYGMNLQFGYKTQNLTLENGISLTFVSNDLNIETNNETGFTPITEVQTNLGYLFPKININLRATHRFIAKQQRFFLQDDKVKLGHLGSNHQINLTLNKAFWGNKIRFSIGVKNMLNQSTQALLGGSATEDAHSDSGQSILTGFGRTFFTRLQFAFGK